MTRTQERSPRGNKDRGVTPSQARTTRTGEAGKDPPREPLEGVWSCWLLDFGPLASRTGGGDIAVDLLQQPRDTDH